MFIDNYLIKLLKSIHSTTKFRIYITDLDKAKCVCDADFVELNNPISKQLLRIILSIEILGNSDSLIIISEKSKIIPIFEENPLNIDYDSGIILPIWFDDHIQGTLIFTSFIKDISEKDIKFAKQTQEFITEYFIKQINENYGKGEFTNE